MNKQQKRIPYTEIKRIINNCTEPRTQAAITFNYIFGCRIGELSTSYIHFKKTKEQGKQLDYGSDGPRVKDFKTRTNSEGQHELVFTKPNFKQKKILNRKKEQTDIHRFESFVNETWEPHLYNILINWIS